MYELFRSVLWADSSSCSSCGCSVEYSPSYCSDECSWWDDLQVALLDDSSSLKFLRWWIAPNSSPADGCCQGQYRPCTRLLLYLPYKALVVLIVPNLVAVCSLQIHLLLSYLSVDDQWCLFHYSHDVRLPNTLIRVVLGFQQNNVSRSSQVPSQLFYDSIMTFDSDMSPVAVLYYMI